MLTGASAVAAAMEEQDADEAGLWAGFAGAATATQFCAAWLDIVCRDLPGAKAAFLLLEEGQGQYKVGAAWPDRLRDLSYLAPAAEQALLERRGLIRGPEPDAALAEAGGQAAYPIEVDGRAHAVVVVDLAAGGVADRLAVIRRLHWGAGWLEVLFRRRLAEEARAAIEGQSFALDMLAVANDHAGLQATAIALVNELAARLASRRVSLGLVRNGAVRVVAISHSARFRAASREVTAIENAMEEALDQRCTVAVPQVGRNERAVVLAHEALARQSGAAGVASVPLTASGAVVGLLTFEHDAPALLDGRALTLLGVAGGLLGPLIATKQRANRLLAGRLVDGAGEAASALLGPGRPGLRLAAGTAVAAAVFLAVWQGDFRISAKAVVEAAQQHAVVMPFDGYVASAAVRAGDRVERGEVLATLDEREARLEALRARATLEEQTVKHAEAVGKQDRVSALTTAAAVDGAMAALAIADDRLGRSTLRSTDEGVVVSGDLSQMLGSPVEKGKTLFEIAPLDQYRVALQVAGSDIGNVSAGQSGALVLSGLTDRVLPFKVREVIPVAAAGDGQTTFRVEATLRDPEIGLRPGMEGIGKVQIDRRPMLSIWLRPVLEWIRMTAWEWRP